MWYIPKLSSEQLLQHQLRRYALFTTAALRLFLRRSCTPEAFKEIEDQFQLILETPINNRARRLDSQEIAWVFMLEPLLIDDKRHILVRGARVTEGWVPIGESDEPADYSSATFTVVLEVNSDENRIVGLAETYGPTTDFRFGATLGVLDMFPPEIEQPPQQEEGHG